MNNAIIGMGSNISPLKNIGAVFEVFQKEGVVTVIKRSSLLRTNPVGFTEQADFINGAILIETEIDHDNLEKYLKSVEIKLGRVKTADKNGPRTIDLDIVVWNDKVIDNDYYTRDYLKKTVDEVAMNRG